MLPSRRIVVGIFLFFCVVSALLYANSSEHVFHLDSGHSVRDNPTVRSLARIPEYFTNPLTFSTLLTNVDYRPVLQTSYALNYSLFGYEMSGWHYTNVVLHAWCGLFLYLVVLRFALFEFKDQPKLAVTAAFLVALAFIVHPVNSGVINYMSARSSELTAVFLLPGFYFCLMQRHWTANLCYLSALFTKVEAVAAFAVFMALMFWTRYPDRHTRLNSWKPAVLYFCSTVFYIAVRAYVMSGLPFADAAGRPGMTGLDYLLTQFTAWWYYLLCWLVPVNLVADNQAYPVFHSVFQHLVVAAIVAWLVVLAWLLRSWRERPYRLLIALSGLALISPTSSIVPLAEMVNEHRPYLPIALVSMLWLFPLVRFFSENKRRTRIGIVLCLAWLATLSSLTVHRNRVFLTSESYWKDVIEKAPSARAHVNYGLIFLQSGQTETALEHFRASLELAPNYHIAHVNTAIALSALGRDEEAMVHYNRAVEAGRGDGIPLLWRARNSIALGNYESALQDIERAETESNDKATIYALRATALAWLNKGEEAARWALGCGEIDFQKLGASIVEISGPFFRSEQTASQGDVFFEILAKRWPNVWWIATNQGELLKKLGRTEEAEAYLQRAQQLKNR